jgi:hypothetical protein
MKYTKMLGLLAVAAAALMAFAGVASATTLTAPSGTVYTSTIKAESEGATSLHGPFTTVTCNNSSVEGKVEKHGAGVTAGGNVSVLTFTNCNFPVTVLKKGSLEIHNIAGTNDGTLTSSGAEVTIQTSIASCIFTTANTDLGRLTAAPSNTGHATLDINSAGIPRTGHSFFCGSSGTWTGAYKVTTPTGLKVDA